MSGSGRARTEKLRPGPTLNRQHLPKDKHIPCGHGYVAVFDSDSGRSFLKSVPLLQCR